MTSFDILAISVALAMDAFAVSICKGLAMQRFRLSKGLIVGLWFGGFQALFPVIGYVLGSVVSGYISRFSGVVAFVLLLFIGIGMIKESREAECDASGGDISPKAMLPAAVATSIDALTVGVTFSAYQVNIVTSAAMIGIITCLICVAGVKIGSVFGDRFQQKAEFAGGVVLILIGIKLLLGV